MEKEPVWIHVKTGHRYEILSHGLQECDLESVVIYRREDGTGPVWVRPTEEFMDGRFIMDVEDPTTEFLNDRSA